MKATDDGSKQFPISVDMPEADPPTTTPVCISAPLQSDNVVYRGSVARTRWNECTFPAQRPAAGEVGVIEPPSETETLSEPRERDELLLCQDAGV